MTGVVKDIADWVALVANLLTAIASGLAIYLFVAKREVLSTVFQVLVSYASQLTLAELNKKLDELNALHAPDDLQEITNVLHEITGQLRGNPKLTPHFTDLIAKIEKSTSGKGKLLEPIKRAIASEIREKIRHVGLLNIEQMTGEKT